MARFLKKALRFGAFTVLVAVVFFTNIVHKLGFSNNPKDDEKNPNDLFASFSSVPTAHADTPGGGPDGGSPNCDSGPCPGGAPH
jgi:hypothetical protein